MDLNVTAITVTVTNLNDSGAGSLRQALIDAQSSTGQVQVIFEPSLAGVITLNSNLSIPASATVTLPDGVSINQQGYNISVYGSLRAEYEEVADAFVSTSTYRYIFVENGGVVELKNANINFSGSYSQVSVRSGGSFSMTGGSMYANYSGAYIQSGGSMSLSGVEVKNKIDNYGSLVLEGVSSSSYISGSGSLTAKDSVITSYVDAYGATSLENVSCSRLNVNSDSAVTTEGAGVTLTGEQAIQLNGYSGTVATLLDNFAWTSTAENAYIGITGYLNTSTLSNITDKLSGGYKLVGDVTIQSGHTVSLSEGVSINQQGGNISVYGSLRAEYEEVADAFVSTSTYRYIFVENGGVVELKNANINFSGSYSQVSVRSGGSFSMTGGSMYANYSGAYIQSGGSMSLSGVEVKNKIENYGTLSLESCTVNKQTVLITQNATASITNTSGISTLTINSGSTVSLVGNDFSATTIKLNNFVEGEVLDLSGNYWGTTDLEAIKAKIQGYSENIVVINDILEVDPTTAFMYLGNSLPQDQIGQGVTEVTFFFSHEIDASTVTTDTLKLVNGSGTVLPLEYLEVEGHNIRVGFAAMQTESNYRLELSSAILDIAGGALQPEPRPGKGHDVLKVNLGAPRISHMEPGGDFTGTLSGITLYFTEAINLTTLKNAVSIIGPDGKKVSITSVESLGGTAYRVNVAEQTAYGQYTVTVASSVENWAGNRMDQNENGTFGEDSDAYTGSFINLAVINQTFLSSSSA